MRRTNESWPPVMRSGVGGASNTIDGAQASVEHVRGRAWTGAAPARAGRRLARAAGAGQRPERLWNQASSGVMVLPVDVRLQPDATAEAHHNLLSRQRFEACDRVFAMLALGKLLEQALEVRDCFCRLIGSRQRLGQIEVDPVPAAEAGVVPEDLPEAVDRPGIPA